MEKLARVILFITASAASFAAFSAGDYVWEEKFNTELPKAEQGDAKAQYAVGEMYEKGRGAVKDLGSAFEWYSKAAQQGDPKSAYKVGYCYLKGVGVERDYGKARDWLKKASDKDYVRAYYYLGDIYENGYGVLQDYDEALKWYKRALEGGYGAAADRMNAVTRAQREQEEERVAEEKARAARAKTRVAIVSEPKINTEPQASATTTPAAGKSTASTKDRVLVGGWKERKKGAEFLPSTITKCTDKGPSIECLSKELQRNIGMADIDYTTKAIVFGFKPDGTFKVSYRNEVTKITVTDPEFADSGEKVPVQLGWQDAEHKLTCEFENDLSVICTKNKTRSIKLHREE